MRVVDGVVLLLLLLFQLVLVQAPAATLVSSFSRRPSNEATTYILDRILVRLYVVRRIYVHKYCQTVSNTDQQNPTTQ